MTTRSARLHDWAYCELADLDAAEYDDARTGLWTRGLLIRRNIADGDLAFFATWCPSGTDIETLVKVEGPGRRSSRFHEQDHRGIKDGSDDARLQIHEAADRFCRAHDELRHLLRLRRRHNQAVSASLRRSRFTKGAEIALTIMQSA